MSRGRTTWWRGRMVLVGGLAAGLGAFAFACGSEDGGGPAACEGAACEDGGPEGSTPSEGGGDTSTTDTGSDGGLDAGDASDSGTACTGPAGTLDPTFGDGGLTWTTYAASGANAVLVQPDAKIVLGGYTSGQQKAALVRFLPNGSLDAAFGTNGLVESYTATSGTSFNAVALQADGKIVAAGASHATGSRTALTLVRHLADGGLDATFGTGGVVLTTYVGRDAYARGLLLQVDGKIVVGGYSEDAFNPDGTQNYEVARYNPDGTLDATFGAAGRLTIDMRATADVPGVIAFASSGRIVVAGSSGRTASASSKSDFTAALLSPTGGFDVGFASAGKFLGAFDDTASLAAASVVADPTGRIVVGGTYGSSSPDDFAMVRLAAGGALDTTFGDGGVVRTDFGGRSDATSALLLQADGKLVAVGTSGVGSQSDTYGIALARYLPDGAADPSFGVSGKAMTLPPVSTAFFPNGAALNGCTLLVAGTLSDQRPLGSTAMLIAAYRR